MGIFDNLRRKDKDEDLKPIPVDQNFRILVAEKLKEQFNQKDPEVLQHNLVRILEKHLSRAFKELNMDEYNIYCQLDPQMNLLRIEAYATQSERARSSINWYQDIESQIDKMRINS